MPKDHVYTTCYKGQKWPPAPIYACNVTELRELRMQREMTYWESCGEVDEQPSAYERYLEGEIARGALQRIVGHTYEECEHECLRPCQ